MKSQYYLVHEKALPDGLKRICAAQALLNGGKARTVSQAVKQVGISRSAYYKYRNLVRPFSQEYQEHIITLQAVLKNRAGVLSNFLNMVAKAGANVITVNQNIPVEGVAGINLSVNIAQMTISREMLVRRLAAVADVQSVEILLGG